MLCGYATPAIEKNIQNRMGSANMAQSQEIDRLKAALAAKSEECERLKKDLGNCGKENCWGQSVEGIRSWTTREYADSLKARAEKAEAALSQANATIKELEAEHALEKSCVDSAFKIQMNWAEKSEAECHHWKDRADGWAKNHMDELDKRVKAEAALAVALAAFNKIMRNTCSCDNVDGCYGYCSRGISFHAFAKIEEARK